MGRIWCLVIRIARDKVVFVVGLALILAACGGSSTAPPKDKIVEGVNFTELFAPPTDVDIRTEQIRWAQRDVSAQGITELAQKSTQFGSSAATIRIVSHTVEGVKHVGAIASVDDAAPGSLPILVYVHGGAEGENLNEVLGLIAFAFGGVPDDYVYVVPSLRAESLMFDNVTYRSEGEPSPWDLDVDDALALVNVAIATVPEADSTRIGVVGFSRGAGVAMLMGERDERINLVVEFFGPTDFFGEYMETLAEEAIRGEPRDLPGLNYLTEKYLIPLRDGETYIGAVRSQMLRRSPVYFVHRLRQLQMHHGTADTVVEVSQAYSMIDAMHADGFAEPEFEAYIYEGENHDSVIGVTSIGRAVAFVERLLVPVYASAGDSTGLGGANASVP